MCSDSVPSWRAWLLGGVGAGFAVVGLLAARWPWGLLAVAGLLVWTRLVARRWHWPFALLVIAVAALLTAAVVALLAVTP